MKFYLSEGKERDLSIRVWTWDTTGQQGRQGWGLNGEENDVTLWVNMRTGLNHWGGKQAEGSERAGAGFWCQVLSELHGTEGQ